MHVLDGQIEAGDAAMDFGEGIPADAAASAAPTGRVSGFRGVLSRSGLGMPAAGMERARWFFWVFDLAGILSCVPPILLRSGLGLGAGAGALRVGGVVGLVVLATVRIVETRRRHLLPVWSELPLVLALGFALFAAGPLSSGMVLLFAGCYFRAVYASIARTLAATLASVALLAATARVSSPDGQDVLVTVVFGLLVSTTLIQMLVAPLARQYKQVSRSERLLSAVFDNLDVAVVVRPTDDAPALMNQAALTLYAQLGLPAPPEVWGDSVAVYDADEANLLRPEQMPTARALSGQRVCEVNVAVQLRDGTRRHFSVNAAPLTDPETCVREVVTLNEVTAQRRATDDLKHQNSHDQLTGLANRTLLHRAIELSLAALRGGGSAETVLLLDLDGFKQVNDSLGHAFGDEVLQAVAERLRSTLRANDVIARLGGDEFAMLVRGEPGAERAQHICDALRAPILLPRSPVSISASFGLVRLEPDMDAARVLTAADLAMYAAKAAGSGLVREFHPAMREALHERMHLEEDLRRGLENNEFEMFYQPFVNLETATVTGSEALVRWRHPTRGLVPLLSFIPIAEDNGMFVALGRWILRSACMAAASWQPTDPAQVSTIAVNVSGRQLLDPGIIADVTSALGESLLSPHALTLEITESALIDDSPAVLERLSQLRALGVKIAVDDFGTGYSSLSRLGTYPSDALKIDYSFVQNIETETGGALVKAILALADALDLDVVAEGIETQRQARALTAFGCRVAQGYYFAKPSPASRNSSPAHRVSFARSPV